MTRGISASPSTGRTVSATCDNAPEPARVARRSPSVHSVAVRIAIGGDHAGYPLKQHFIGVLNGWGHAVDDLGTDSTEPIDYPPYLRGGGARGRARRGRCRHRARRQRPGRADLGQQGARRPRRALQRPLHRAHGAPAQRRQRALDRRPDRRAGARRGDHQASSSTPRSRAAATSAVSTRSRRSRSRSRYDDSPGENRSRDRRDHRAGARAPEHDDPADRVGELHVAGRARGAGFGAHQQVLRGLSGQALLRRQPRGRRGREPRTRPCVRAVRRRARQRAAALGRERQSGRVHGAARAGRQGDGHAPRSGRPPHARFAGQLQRPHVRLRRVRRRRQRPRCSTTTRSATSRCASGRA